MPRLFGTYECKVDSKGRLRVPTQLLRKMGAEESESFVLNRGMETHLSLYTREVFEEVADRVNNLNHYVKRNREFKRYFYRGATEVVLDSTDRVLITKRLAEYAGIKKDVVLFAVDDHVEIWARDAYDSQMEAESEDFSDLAEEVLGGTAPTNDDE